MFKSFSKNNNVSLPTSSFEISGALSLYSLVSVNGNAFFDGNIEITGDLNFDDATVDNLTVGGIATVNQLEFGVGVGRRRRQGHAGDDGLGIADGYAIADDSRTTGLAILRGDGTGDTVALIEVGTGEGVGHR